MPNKRTEGCCRRASVARWLSLLLVYGMTALKCARGNAAYHLDHEKRMALMAKHGQSVQSLSAMVARLRRT
jgi:hypothetical protein